MESDLSRPSQDIFFHSFWCIFAHSMMHESGCISLMRKVFTSPNSNKPHTRFRVASRFWHSGDLACRKSFGGIHNKTYAAIEAQLLGAPTGSGNRWLVSGVFNGICRTVCTYLVHLARLTIDKCLLTHWQQNGNYNPNTHPPHTSSMFFRSTPPCSPCNHLISPPDPVLILMTMNCR